MAKFEFDEKALRTIAKILEESGLTEIEVESNDQVIRVAKQPAPVTQVASAPAAPPAAAAPAAASAPGAGPGEAPKDAVTSPMVGTVYLAPEPGSANFVSVGDSVKEGQTLLIIEAMKVMNPLASPKSGKVSRILIEDGQPVEFGEPLIVIE